jgi:ATP-dependent exoDNAse (exonuclease V) beta subunit
VPQLAPMLSEEEQRNYDAAIAELVGRARQNLAKAKGRTLSQDMQDIVQRAEEILARAEQQRKQDPAAAKSLAERAELLSRELVQ